MNASSGAALAAPCFVFAIERIAASLWSNITSMDVVEPAPRDRNEEIAIAAVRDGDHGAYDYLVQKYMRKALSISWGIVRDAHDAEDLTQEAFVRAFQKIGSVKSADAFSGWLYRIVANLSLDHLRRKKRRPTETLLESYAATNRSDAISSEALSTRIDTAIETLPEMQRVVARLFLVEEFSHAEIAGMLGLTDGTVRSHLSHARRKLQELLSDVYEVGS
jgi:RNA polymerase sigma-70 factor (ECF subfamily)